MSTSHLLCGTDHEDGGRHSVFAAHNPKAKRKRCFCLFVLRPVCSPTETLPVVSEVPFQLAPIRAVTGTSIFKVVSKRPMILNSKC